MEKIDWVFVLRVGNSMNGDSVLIILKHAHYDRRVEFIDQVVNFGLQGLDAFKILVTELVHLSLDEQLHIFN